MITPTLFRFVPGRRAETAEECDERVCLSVCLLLCNKHIEVDQRKLGREIVEKRLSGAWIEQGGYHGSCQMDEADKG